MKTNYRKVSKVLFATITALIFIIGCSGKPNAVGLEDEIFLIADSTDYFQLEPTLYETFSKVIYTPQPETLFDLKRLPFEKLKSVDKMKNIIILAPLDGLGNTAKYLRSILDSTVFDLVSSGKEFVINKNDMWANNQLIMILTGPTLDDLNKNILLNKENLLHYFRKASNKRLLNGLYNSSFENKKIEAELLKNYGWMIYIQSDFKIGKDAPEDNFVWIRRGFNTDMERWIFVHWIDNANPKWLNQDSISTIRDRLTNKYYLSADNSAHVVIAQDQLTTYEEVNFLDRYALMSNGFWRFSDKSGGGPFLSYAFYDEASKRIYILDGSIFAPKYYKKKLIQQLDVTLQSFLLKHEMGQDRVERLMKELD